MLGRTDVERIVENMLKDLSIEIRLAPAWQGPNDRKAELLYKGEVISYTYFNVTQQDK